jgi:hypothetical protein
MEYSAENGPVTNKLLFGHVLHQHPTLLSFIPQLFRCFSTFAMCDLVKSPNDWRVEIVKSMVGYESSC